MNDIDRVREQALRTAERYPWYASLLTGDSGQGGQPPLLTAALMEKWYYAVTPPNAAALARYSTSGTSSGRRKNIYYSDADESRYIRSKAELFRAWLLGEDPPVRKVLSDMGTGHAAGTADDVFRSIGLTAESISFELPIERHIEMMECFQPDVLYTMPSILDKLADAAGNPEHLGVRRIILVGEIATPSWQRKMARLFGIADTAVLDTYGSIEIGTIAHYSPEIGRYIVLEGLYAEAVPVEELGEGYEPLAPDEQVLVLTSFIRDEFPAVRYVTYDVVRDFRPMEIDGVTRYTYQAIVKRIGPELKHGEKLSLYDIEETVLSYAKDALIRVEVKDRKLTVRIQSKSLSLSQLPEVKLGIEHRIPEIGKMIRGRLLDEIQVTLSAGPDPETSPGGIKSRKIHY